MFFVLSGFLLGERLDSEFRQTGTVDRMAFLAKRARRIWPLYFFAVFVIAYLLPAPYAMFPDEARGWVHSHIGLYAGFQSNWALGFGGIGDYVNRFGPPLDTLWTIAVEQHFYVALALLFPIVAGSKRPALWIGAMLLSGIVARAAWVAIPVLRPIDLNLYVASTSYIDVFTVGVLAGVLYARNAAGVASALSRWWTGPALLALTVIVHHAIAAPSFGHSRPAIILLYGVFAACCSAFMLWLLARPDGWFARALSSWLPVKLGALSYGLYVWHMPVEAAFRHWMQPFGDTASIVSLPLVIAVTAIVSSVTYKLIERPMQRTTRPRLRDVLRPAAAADRRAKG